MTQKKQKIEVTEEETRTVVLAAPAGLTELNRFGFAAADALVVTADNHDDVGEKMRWVVARLKHWRSLFKELRQPIVDAEKAHRQIERDKLSGGVYYADTVKKKILAWELEEDRKAKERQRLADEKAEKLAKKERDRQAEEIRRLAQAARTKREKVVIEQKAAAVAKAPLPITSAPQVSRTYDRIAGTSRRETWEGEVTQIGLVLKFLADGKLPVTLISFRQVELNKLATTHKEQLSVVFPGLAANKKNTLAG